MSGLKKKDAEENIWTQVWSSKNYIESRFLIWTIHTLLLVPSNKKQRLAWDSEHMMKKNVSEFRSENSKERDNSVYSRIIL
jgi:hypothetical protein